MFLYCVISSLVCILYMHVCVCVGMNVVYWGLSEFDASWFSGFQLLTVFY